LKWRNLNSFFITCVYQKKVDCKFTLGHTHGRMIGLLAWLQEWTAEQAIEKVLQYLKTEDRKRVRDAILTAMEGYNTCRNSIVKHLGLNETVDCDAEDEQLSTVDGSALPEQFCNQFRSGSFPPYFLNTLVKRRVFLLTQIEDWSQTSSYTCSLSIRKVIYGILSSLDTLIGASETDEEKNFDILITEHAQHAGNLNRSHIQPLFKLPQFGVLPKLDDLCNLSSSKRLALLFEVLKIKNLDFHCSLPEDWQLFLCSLVYCSQSVANSISLQFLNSVILMALYVYFVSGPIKRIKNKSKNKELTADAKNAKDLLSVVIGSSDSNKAFERLAKYESEPRINNTHPPDIKGLHWYAEFQSCLLFASYLNRLLGSPLRHFMPSHFLNGTFLYNAYQDLKNRSCPDLFLAEILCKGSAIQGMFLEIRDAVLQEVGKEVFVTIPVANGRKSRKKRKTTKKHDQRHPSSSSNRNSDCSEKNYVASCALSNKYVNLNVDDIE